MTYTATGQEVLCDGQHVADAATAAYATAIAAALNATSVDRRVSSPVMREVRTQSGASHVYVPEYDTHGTVPDPHQSPDTLRTLRGDEGRLDIFRGVHRLGYIDAEDALYLIGDDTYATLAERDVDRSRIAELMARHRR